MRKSHAHPTEIVTSPSGLKLIQVLPEIDVEIYKQDKDGGYHRFGNDWWVNGRSPYSFQYISVESLYPRRYFGPQTGHPDTHQANNLYDYMQQQYKAVFGKNFRSVIELGTGGGELTQCFHAAALDYVAIEGTSAGVERLESMGIEKDRIFKYNLKFMPVLDRRFDLAMCTEVAEHLEPFFASKIVDNCIKHSDVVWFSAADRNRRAHYHHMNEQNIEVWDNLFATMGFTFYVPLDGRFGRASRIYLSGETGRRLLRADAQRG